MTRTIFIASAVLPVVFFIGCGEQVRDDARFRADPAMAVTVTEQGFGVPDAAEVDLVEQLAVVRQDYRAALQRLVDYYAGRGDATKLAWAKRELNAQFQYRYLMPAESALASMRATDPVPAADELFEKAEKLFKDAGGILMFTGSAKLRTALNDYNQIIAAYPTSDKIDDAAYRAGRIYEHFRDYEIAATYYQRAFQWDENTPYPARFRAAYVMDQNLHKRGEALTLYQLAREKESRFGGYMEFTDKRILELTMPFEGSSGKNP